MLQHHLLCNARNPQRGGVSVASEAAVRGGATCACGRVAGERLTARNVKRGERGATVPESSSFIRLGLSHRLNWYHHSRIPLFGIYDSCGESRTNVR